MTAAWAGPIAAAAAAAADAHGVDVLELDGWRTRGHGTTPGRLLGTMWHDTVTPYTPAWHDLHLGRLLRDGHSTLPGPIANVGVGQGGTLILVAAGRAYHAGSGAWPGIPSGNLNTVGVEVANPGLGSGHPWRPVQLAVARTFTAVLHQLLDLPASRLVGHKEWTARKVDPWSVAMDVERRDLFDRLPKEDPMAGITLDDIRAVVRDELNRLPAPAPDRLHRINETVRLSQAAAAGAVGAVRRDLQLPADPASDLVHARRIRSTADDGYTLVEVLDRLQQAADEAAERGELTRDRCRAIEGTADELATDGA